MGLTSSRSAAERHHSESQESERPQQSTHGCAPPAHGSKNSNKTSPRESATASLSSPTDNNNDDSTLSMLEPSDSSASENTISVGGLLKQVPGVHSCAGSSSGAGEFHCDSRQRVRGVSETRERRAPPAPEAFIESRQLSIDPSMSSHLGDNGSLSPAGETLFQRHHMETMHECLRRYADLCPARDVEEPERTSPSLDTSFRVRSRRLETTSQTRTNTSGYSNSAANDTRNAYDGSVQSQDLSLSSTLTWGRPITYREDSAVSEEIESRPVYESVGNPRSLQSSASAALFSAGTAGGSSQGESLGREARRTAGRRFWDVLTRAPLHRHANNHRGPMEDEEPGTSTFGRAEMANMNGAIDAAHSEREGGFYYRYRSLNLEERRRRFRSQVWALQRLSSRLEGVPGHAMPCTSGARHQGIRRSHESVQVLEETNMRASISRIIMLAEALFEVLDEIHRQSIALSRSTGLSFGLLPAPDSVVESLPVKIYRRADIAEDMEEDALQCHICLVEYEDGDEARVLPCHHEYHVSCIDKWLREVHRACPLCRGDVCELRDANYAS